MFVLVPERKVWWPVKWLVPVDGGEETQVQIEMHFRLPNDEGLGLIDGSAEEIDAAAHEEGLSPAQVRARFWKALILDWKGVGTSPDETLPFNEDALAQLFAQPRVHDAVAVAYRNCRNGEPELRAKN